MPVANPPTERRKENQDQANRKLSLSLQLAVKFTFVFVLFPVMFFLPAGTLNFWQGWATLGAYFLPASFGYLYFFIKDREVVRRRLETREPVDKQKWIRRLAAPGFFLGFLIPGFDHRWGWSRQLIGQVPLWLNLLSLALIAGSFLFIFWVLDVNRFAASTIRVEEGQHVISTGPYGLVRHPMYLGSVVLFLSTPLALGSWVALPVVAIMVPFYVFRLLGEEKLLRSELPGYDDYCQRTRYRLIPFLW